MEPLDPVAELMRLADEYGTANFRDSQDRLGFHSKPTQTRRAELAAAIIKALADARRLALEEAADAVCRVARAAPATGGVMMLWQSDALTAIRALIDGKAGGT